MRDGSFKHGLKGGAPLALALLLAWAALSAGCLRLGPRREKIKIGVFVSLTGATGDYGLSSVNGFRMAAEELNAAGGIDGHPVELMVEDTRSDASETEVVARRLIAERGATALLGEVVSSRSLAAAPIAQAARVPMLTPSSTSPEVTERGDFVFRSCYTDPYQAAALAHFATAGLHARRAALLVDRMERYSVELARLISQAFARAGGQVVAEFGYSEGDEDFTQQLMEVGAASPDVIFVPGYYREAGLIAKRARELGIDAPLVGGDGWDSPALYQIGGEALRDTFFSNHFSADDTDPEVRAFVERFVVMYGFRPDAFAATAYDAARIMFAAVARAGSADPQAVRDALAATRDFKGVTGTVTFDAARNAVKPVVIVRVETGGVFAVQERITPQPPEKTPTPREPDEKKDRRRRRGG